MQVGQINQLTNDAPSTLTAIYQEPLSPGHRYRLYSLPVANEMRVKLERLREQIVEHCGLSFSSEQSFLVYLMLEGADAAHKLVQARIDEKAAQQQSANTAMTPADTTTDGSLAATLAGAVAGA